MIPYNYIKKLYNILYIPQNYHIQEFYNRNIYSLGIAVGIIWPYY